MGVLSFSLLWYSLSPKASLLRLMRDQKRKAKAVLSTQETVPMAFLRVSFFFFSLPLWRGNIVYIEQHKPEVCMAVYTSDANRLNGSQAGRQEYHTDILLAWGKSL